MGNQNEWVWLKRISIHLEVNSVCNAMCPMCYDRNYIDDDQNVKRLENNCNYQVSFSEFKRWFSNDFFMEHSIKKLTICGTESEPTLNNDLEKMIKYIKEKQPSTLIRISTNGSTHNETWWENFGNNLKQFKKTIQIIVGIDGIGTNHERYRLNTNYYQIIKNMQAFINGGGRAVWQFIVFDHNQEDLNAAKEIALKMGFYDFIAKYSNYLSREKRRELTFKWKGKTIQLKSSEANELNEKQMNTSCNIDCYSKQMKEIFISYKGIVYPCSWIKSSLKGSYGLTETENSLNVLKQFSVREASIHQKGINDILNDKSKWLDLQESWEDVSTSPKVCDLYCGKRQHETQCYFDIASKENEGPERQDKIN